MQLFQPITALPPPDIVNAASPVRGSRRSAARRTSREDANLTPPLPPPCKIARVLREFRADIAMPVTNLKSHLAAVVELFRRAGRQSGVDARAIRRLLKTDPAALFHPDHQHDRGGLYLCAAGAGLAQYDRAGRVDRGDRLSHILVAAPARCRPQRCRHPAQPAPHQLDRSADRARVLLSGRLPCIPTAMLSPRARLPSTWR